jgi:hypothetical protein
MQPARTASKQATRRRQHAGSRRPRRPALHGVARLPLVVCKMAVWLLVLLAFPAAVHLWSSQGTDTGTSASPLPRAAAQPAVSRAAFDSCHDLRAAHHGGVARPGARNTGRPLRPSALVLTSRSLYAANARLDTDHDGIACERVRKQNR